MTRRKITEADKEAARTLKKLWDAKYQALGLSQDKAAAELGVTQGMVSHYLTGKRALGTEATLKFAHLLQVEPSTIRPDLPHLQALTGELEPEAREVALLWQRLPKAFREDLRRSITTLLDTGYSEYLDAQEQGAKARKGHLA